MGVPLSSPLSASAGCCASFGSHIRVKLRSASIGRKPELSGVPASFRVALWKRSACWMTIVPLGTVSRTSASAQCPSPSTAAASAERCSSRAASPSRSSSRSPRPGASRQQLSSGGARLSQLPRAAPRGLRTSGARLPPEPLRSAEPLLRVEEALAVRAQVMRPRQHGAAVMLLGLARRTARRIEKVSLAYVGPMPSVVSTG